jgi:peptidoglycan hydrolase-like protein with peptidoglycan-binding domain
VRMPHILAAAAAAVLVAGTAATAATAAPQPTLRFGDRGPAVQTLQQDLIDLGYSHAAATPGAFGAETWLALTAFQRTAFPGTVALGDADPVTWAAIARALAGEGSGPIGTTALSPGARGPAVATLQGDLLQLGYAGIGSATGQYGAATAAAVSDFQSRHGLPVTGVMDGATLRAILKAMAATPTPMAAAAPAAAVAPGAAATPGGGPVVGGSIAGHTITGEIDLVATAYGPSLQDNYPYGPFDAFGQPLAPGDVAVDPSVIPLNTRLYVTGYSSPYLPAGGELALARDTGGAIKGKRIDIFIDGTPAQVSSFGIQHVVAYILGN